jgi:hypothetical protein
LSDDAFYEKMMKYLKRATKNYSKYGPAGYNLGDENCVSAKMEVCYGEKTLKELREWLETKYGSLESLNKVWKSSFNDWGDVMPLSWEQARKDKNYASWLDHRLFMENKFSEAQFYARDVIKSIDSQARVGFEGPLQRRTSTGYDFYRLFKGLGLFGLYPTPVDRFGMLESFMDKKSLRGSWFGAYIGAMNKNYTRAFPWHCLFEGLNSCWWFGGVMVKGAGGEAAFTVDFSPFDYFLAAVDEIKEIKSGVGALFFNSRMEKSPVAIYYSPFSKYAYAVAGVKSPVSYENSMDSFCYLLNDLGFSNRFISSVEVAKGELSPESCKAIILPSARILSAMEIENIKRYVKEGGTVIADLPPATMDIHCVLRKGSAIKELFGNFNSIPNYNILGKGKAVYLGTFFKTYIAERIAGAGEDKRRLFKTILKNSGIVPKVRVATKDGTSLRSTKIAVSKAKDADYAGLLYFSGTDRNPAMRVKELKPEKVKIKFWKKSHVYDVRRNKYLGYTDETETVMQPSQAKVFALLRKKIESIELTLSGKKFKQGESLKYNISMVPAVSSVVRLEVFDSHGKTIPYYAKNIHLDRGFSSAIPLALNETPGEYAIKATETVSGKSAVGKYIVSGKSGEAK